MKKTGITRKQAIKKMGKYAALTAIGTFNYSKSEKGYGQLCCAKPGWMELILK